MADVMELDYNRCLYESILVLCIALVHLNPNNCRFPLFDLAHQHGGPICRLMHRSRLPRRCARLPPPPKQAIRGASPATIPALRCSANNIGPHAVFLRRQPGARANGAYLPSQSPAAAGAGATAHAAVRARLHYHADRHVLQWVHDHLHLPRRVSGEGVLRPGRVPCRGGAAGGQDNGCDEGNGDGAGETDRRVDDGLLWVVRV